MITIDTVVDVIQRHYPYPWAKDSNLVMNWLIWFIQKQFAICVTEDHRTISGLGMFRPMMDATDGLWTYRFDYEGPVIYCDFFYAQHNQAMRGVIIEATRRFGRREKVAWQRRGGLHVVPADKFALHILKENENEPAQTSNP